MEKWRIGELQKLAITLRLEILEQVYHAKCGHPGGSLSIVEVLEYLYFEKMRIDPQNPMWADRDRLVLSKGHAAPALYAVLAERGYFPKEDLKTLRQIDSYLQGHPDMRTTPGVDISTGSLGIGLSNACGMALAGRIQKKDYRVYCILGDGELQEGQNWEAAMYASHYKLDHLTAFVDANGLQIDGRVCDVCSSEPIDARFAAFGWHVQRINGHDFSAIEAAVAKAEAVKQPSVIVCDTVKGKGVSFMENNAGWHGKAPKEEEYLSAVAELKSMM